MILIPSVATIPTNGILKGQLIFLKTIDNDSGFYIRTRYEWDLSG